MDDTILHDQTGTVIQTATGGSFDIMNPRPEDIKIADIAVSMTNQIRFTGHTCFPGINLADHSLRVVEVCRRWGLHRTALDYALIHDVHEAYVGDNASPWKRAVAEAVLLATGVEYSPIKDLEHDIDHAVFQRFDVWPCSLEKRLVKEADTKALLMERDMCMEESNIDWGIVDPEPEMKAIWPRNPLEVWTEFKEELVKLAERNGVSTD